MKKYTKLFLYILVLLMVMSSTLLFSCKKNEEENNNQNNQEEDVLYKYVEGMNNVIEFGEYPQTFMKEISPNMLRNDGIYREETGLYEYNGDKYAIVKTKDEIISIIDSVVKFSDGTYVKESKEYVFKVEKIKWKILQKEENKALLMAIYALDLSEFQNTMEYYDGDYYTSKHYAFYANNYQESTIRYFLNNTFYNIAFNEKEKAIVNTSRVINRTQDNNLYGKVQNNTNDKVYILSKNEILGTKYGFMGPTNRLIAPSDYAIARGAMYRNSDNVISTLFLLRSASTNSLKVDCIDVHGNDSTSYIADSLSIIPVINISL